MLFQATDQQLTWRALLGKLIADQAERLRIVEASGIPVLTLQRWVQGETDPRFDTLQALLAAVPVHREKLLALILVEFPAFTYFAESLGAFPGQVAWSGPTKSIPSAFFERVLYTYATTPPGLLFWSICRLVLQQALIQLDPEQLGMVITVAKCMPAMRDGKVRCLWELVEVGTPPWRGDLVPTTVFLGAESLAGYAVASCSPAIIQRLRENPDSLPARKVKHGESAASYPLLRASYIAGCLTVSSVERDYFTAHRLSLIESYSRLLMLAFPNEELYTRGSIELGMMPPDEVQRAHLSTFRQRVNALLIDTAQRDDALSMAQAEQRVRAQIVEQFLQPAPRS